MVTRTAHPPPAFAAQVTRGRYYAPGQPVDDKERPLSLHIRPAVLPGQTEEQRAAAMQAAVDEINAMISGQPRPAAPAAAPAHAHTHAPPPGVYAAPPPGALAAGPPPILIYVGINNAPTEFGLAGRIQGPGELRAL